MDMLMTILLADAAWSLVRTIGWILIFMLFAVGLIYVKGHRAIFICLIAWDLVIVAAIFLRQLGYILAYRMFLNTVVTLAEASVIIAMACYVANYLRKLDKGLYDESAPEQNGNPGE